MLNWLAYIFLSIYEYKYMLTVLSEKNKFVSEYLLFYSNIWLHCNLTSKFYRNDQFRSSLNMCWYTFTIQLPNVQSFNSHFYDDFMNPPELQGLLVSWGCPDQMPESHRYHKITWSAKHPITRVFNTVSVGASLNYFNKFRACIVKKE